MISSLRRLVSAIKKSFLIKIYLAFIAIILIIEIIVLGFFLVTANDFVLTKAFELSMISLENSRDVVNNVFNQMLSSIKNLNFNSIFLEILLSTQNERTPLDRLRVDRQVTDAFSLILNPFPVDGVYISVIGGNNEMYTSYMRQESAVKIITERYQSYLRRNTYIWLTDEWLESNMFVSAVGTNSNHYIALLGPMQKLLTSQPVGFALIHFDWEGFHSLLKSHLWATTSQIQIYNRKSGIIYFSTGNDLSELYGTDHTSWPQNRSYTIEVDKNRKFLVNSISLPISDLAIVEIIPYEALFSDLSALQSRIILYMMITAMLTIISTYLLYRRSSRPLKELNAAIEMINKEDFSVSLNVNSDDDIGLICKNFNLMSSHIQYLFSKLKEEQNEAVRLELEALQLQMRPHFLLNSLNSIRWVAIMSQAENVAEMTSALSNLLRIVIDTTDKLVPLEQEIKMVQDYVLIQKIRFHGAFKVIYNLQVETLPVLLPKLSIQPIVENAILHGIDQQDIHGRIIVSAIIDNGILEVSVSDNGRGMDSEKLIDIEKKLAGTQTLTPSGIGLVNVHQRLQITYGSEFGLIISSIPQQGTCVKLRVPENNGRQMYV